MLKRQLDDLKLEKLAAIEEVKAGGAEGVVHALVC